MAGMRMGEERRGGVAWVFTATLFLSAFLMFLVQPMFAKMALPRLGGSSAVWSLALVFFQALLLAGYSYAHLLIRGLGFRNTVIAHMLVSILALASLPVSISAGWDAPPEQGPVFWLLALFAGSVGLPFFALSANAPLLQAWFARAGQERSRDPYFLYAASNIGSFAALLAYPFAVEPFIGLVPQSRGWSAAFLLLICLIGLCGVLAWRGAEGAFGTADAEPDDRPLTWKDRSSWIAYAALPTALLVAATANITLDVMAAPFLWILPLAVYLLTFVIAFQGRPIISHALVMSRFGLYGTAFAVLALLPLDFVYAVPVHLLLCFVLMLGCHGELAARRPSAARITEFYFFVSLGGVLGGTFSSLVAPVLFRSVVEYPVLIVATLAALGLAGRGRAALTPTVWRGVAVVPVVVLLFFGYLHASGWMETALLSVWLIFVLVWLGVGRREPLAMVPLLIAVLASYHVAVDRGKVLARSRSFYGVLTVKESADGRFHTLQHGTTAHGWQRVRNADGTPISGRPESQAYYFASGPFGSAVRHVREAMPQRQLGEVALVGLGTGSLLCLSQPGERWRFFEIDPQVLAIASDPRYFSFLSRCGPAAGVTIGDGRLQLAKVADESLSLIVLDAFSSDSIPAHLMTREALQLYMAKLKPGGIAVFHTSNRFMDLSTVVASAAASLNLPSWQAVREEGRWPVERANNDALPFLVVVAKTPGSVPGFDTDPGWKRDAGDGGAAAWTDDYSNILGASWRSLFAPPPASVLTR